MFPHSVCNETAGDGCIKKHDLCDLDTKAKWIISCFLNILHYPGSKIEKKRHAYLFFPFFADVTKSHRWACAPCLLVEQLKNSHHQNIRELTTNHLKQNHADHLRHPGSEGAVDQAPTEIFLFHLHSYLDSSRERSACQTKKLAKGENDKGSIFSQKSPTDRPRAVSLSLSLSFLLPGLFCSSLLAAFLHTISPRGCPSHSSPRCVLEN